MTAALIDRLPCPFCGRSRVADVTTTGEVLMATYTRRRVITERLEWHVPARDPWGATWTEVMKAISAAGVELRQFRGLPDDAALPDDAVTLKPADEGIVVIIELRQTEETS